MRRTRAQQGAVAVLVAVLATLLFSIAALSFDLGNAWARRRDVQAEADFAALAAGAQLRTSGGDEAVRVAALDYLRRNATLGQEPLSWNTAQLDDGAPDNGEVDILADGNRVRVLTPPARVDYGFAQVMGVEPYTDVSAVAAVGLMSPARNAMMPMYIASGCDWGLQTITNPPPGQGSSGSTVPVLYPLSPPSTEKNPNDAKIASITPSAIGVGAVSPLTISGSKLSGVTRVGFTTATGQHVTYDLGGTNNPQASVQVPAIPATVASTEGIWYVRVWKGSAWSNNDEAKPLVVGSSTVLQCLGPTSGNFGTLRLPRTDVPTGEALAMNIAVGSQLPVAAFPSPVPTFCDGDARAVEGVEGSTEPVNCLQTDPGVTANAVTRGLVTGVAGRPGRLSAPTTPGCDPAGGDAELLLENVRGSDDFPVNNDVLTCFFTSSSVRVGDVSAATYLANSGKPTISPAIFDSPRFLWIPVLSVIPAQGTSHRYPIVTFRPAFITDQPLTATRSVPTPSSPTNGLAVSTNGITKVNVVMLNPQALPETATTSGPVMGYLGTGTRILRLVE